MVVITKVLIFPAAKFIQTAYTCINWISEWRPTKWIGHVSNLIHMCMTDGRVFVRPKKIHGNGALLWLVNVTVNGDIGPVNSQHIKHSAA